MTKPDYIRVRFSCLLCQAIFAKKVFSNLDLKMLLLWFLFCLFPLKGDCVELLFCNFVAMPYIIFVFLSLQPEQILDIYAEHS